MSKEQTHTKEETKYINNVWNKINIIIQLLFFR